MSFSETGDKRQLFPTLGHRMSPWEGESILANLPQTQRLTLTSVCASHSLVCREIASFRFC